MDFVNNKKQYVVNNNTCTITPEDIKTLLKLNNLLFYENSLLLNENETLQKRLLKLERSVIKNFQ